MGQSAWVGHVADSGTRLGVDHPELEHPLLNNVIHKLDPFITYYATQQYTSRSTIDTEHTQCVIHK